MDWSCWCGNTYHHRLRLTELVVHHLQLRGSTRLLQQPSGCETLSLMGSNTWAQKMYVVLQWIYCCILLPYSCESAGHVLCTAQQPSRKISLGDRLTVARARSPVEPTATLDCGQDDTKRVLALQVRTSTPDPGPSMRVHAAYRGTATA